jgi:plastocyanin
MKALAAITLACCLTGCSSGLNRPVQEVTAETGADGVQHVKVVAHSYWFEPNRVVVRAGKPVELELKNGAMFVPHNFTCTAPDADITVSEDLRIFWGGKKAQFTPTKPGEYRFYCHVGGHAKKGMAGTLVVVDK